MSNSQGWLEVLKPWLESKLNNSWLDPRKIKDKDKFFYEYVVAWGFAQAVRELLEFVNSQEGNIKYLKDKKDGVVKDDFKIGK